jgi:CsoR family transcriptional regulator, copper-sensing transcriptional repressor
MTGKRAGASGEGRLEALGASTGTHPVGSTPVAARASVARRPSHVPHAGCACGVHDTHGRKAIGVDPEIKDRNLKRLRRIEGQVRGLQRMVEEERYCADVLTQLSSVHEALRGVAREVMRNHLKHCAATAIRSGDRDAQEEMYDELLELMYTHAR